MLSQIETATETATGAISKMGWAEFGALGLVCVSLFILLSLILWDNKRDRKEMRDEHTSERAEWRKDAKELATSYTKSSDRVTTAVEQLTEAVKDMRRDLR